MAELAAHLQSGRPCEGARGRPATSLADGLGRRARDVRTP